MHRHYWTADFKKVVGGIPLTAEEACNRVSRGGSVMCRHQAAARYIVFANGYVNAVGPERHKNGYLYYHPTRNHKGYASIHIWYFG